MVTTEDDQRVLAGLRIVELSVAVAGPCSTRALSYHGAEVIKIESRVAPDIIRLFGSAWARDEDHAEVFFDTSPYLGEMCAGKKSIGLELKDPAAMALARTLISSADVFLTNYTPGAVVGLEMTYDDLRPLNEQLIYVTMPGFGIDPTLPYYPFRAFGPNQAPLVGFDALTGYPDQEPAGIASIAPPDYVAGMHSVIAILSALEHRDQTGEGTAIVVSQLETTVSLLGPYLVDHAITERTPAPDGNRIPWAVPSGVYPCSGDDVHVAVSATSDEMWAGLVAAVGDAALAEVALEDRGARWDAHDAIDAAIAAWTSLLTPAEAAARLQAAGVAAYEVLDHRGVLVDPQARDRQFYDVAPSKRFGRDLMSGHPIRLSETPAYASWSAPNMGEHTREVLISEAGASEEEVDALIESGSAFTDRAPDRQLKRPFDDWYEIAGLIGPDAEGAGA